MIDATAPPSQFCERPAKHRAYPGSHAATAKTTVLFVLDEAISRAGLESTVNTTSTHFGPHSASSLATLSSNAGSRAS
eukprot:7384483-Prymnesium_polylepis.1